MALKSCMWRISSALINIEKYQFCRYTESHPKECQSPLSNFSEYFACSGDFSIQMPFQMFYGTKYEQRSIQFPVSDPNEIEEAIKHAKKSAFGRRKQNVIDEQYRLAFEFMPENLGLPSSLVERVTQEVCIAISKQLSSNIPVHAELLKLNIYPKGGFFKEHVDTPKKDAFGSLVVFLPSYFDGGDLCVEHKDEVKVFSFGGKSSNQTKISWAAFYNDCVHNITKVSAGNRLTLSYNLFYEKAEPRIHPHKEMVGMLSSLEKGKTHIYYCEHYYGNNALQMAGSDSNLPFLKGKDYALWKAAESLYLKSELKAIFKFKDYDEDGNPLKILCAPAQKISDILPGYFYHNDDPDYTELQWLQMEKYAAELNAQSLVWLNRPKGSSMYVHSINGAVGNQYDLNQSYCELAILIHT